MSEPKVVPTPVSSAVDVSTTHESVDPNASAPSSPTRAFCAFNDSVDNVNLEDVRDMLPEDVWRDVQPAGAAEELGQQLEVIAEDDDGTEAQETSKVNDESELVQESREPQESQDSQQEDLLEQLELEQEPSESNHHYHQGDAASSCNTEVSGEEGHPAIAPSIDTTTTQHQQQQGGGIDAARYVYGPAIPSKKQQQQGKGLYGDSGGGRSYAEVAEALVLSIAVFLKELTSTRHPLQRYDELEGESGGSSSTKMHIPGRRVRGALGYVFHTVLSAVYVLVVKYPLQLAVSAFHLLLSGVTAIVSAALQLIWWAVSVYLWVLMLPLRLAQRALTLLWQRVLSRAVQFLNQQPGSHHHSFATGGSGGPHKHTIPTAINGHAHKH